MTLAAERRDENLAIYQCAVQGQHRVAEVEKEIKRRGGEGAEEIKRREERRATVDIWLPFLSLERTGNVESAEDVRERKSGEDQRARLDSSMGSVERVVCERMEYARNRLERKKNVKTAVRVGYDAAKVADLCLLSVAIPPVVTYSVAGLKAGQYVDHSFAADRLQEWTQINEEVASLKVKISRSSQSSLIEVEQVLEELSERVIEKEKRELY